MRVVGLHMVTGFVELCKHAIKRYLDMLSQALGQKPSIPLYEFLLRSGGGHIIFGYDDNDCTKKCRSQYSFSLFYLDTNVMLYLFDRLAKKDSFDFVTSRQPPHQQSFSTGCELDCQYPEMDIKVVCISATSKTNKQVKTGYEKLSSSNLKWTKGEAINWL